MVVTNIREIESFWNANPCGLPETCTVGDKKAFFDALEKQRYEKQPLIPSYARFASYKDKKVLEVGCGIGADGLQFARNGAEYTGVDLTENAVNITRERFALSGQTGQFIRLNAEKLPFPDNHFDHVYSFGVIHHSVSPERIVSEIYRVLKPGGSILVMLYNRTSFYYLIEVEFIRKMFFKLCDKEGLCRALFSPFNKNLRLRFEAFRQKLANMKLKKGRPSEAEWISMNTDDVFCPMARVYSGAEAQRLFKAFHNFKTSVWFIDTDNWFLWLGFVRFLPRRIVKWLEFRAGWFRMIEAEK
jgi:ubiquinone/menaquinone biosynthesis C-methylase UbiE